MIKESKDPEVKKFHKDTLSYLNEAKAKRRAVMSMDASEYEDSVADLKVAMQGNNPIKGGFGHRKMSQLEKVDLIREQVKKIE